MPELDHVGLRRPADGHEMLRALREEGEYVREIEHPRARILPGNVEVRKVVYRRRCRERIPCTDAPVRRADDEPVEVAAATPYPERQNEEMPQHRKHGAARPSRGRNDSMVVRWLGG